MLSMSFAINIENKLELSAEIREANANWQTELLFQRNSHKLEAGRPTTPRACPIIMFFESN
jgi:predicted transcriptional regulator